MNPTRAVALRAYRAASVLRPGRPGRTTDRRAGGAGTPPRNGGSLMTAPGQARRTKAVRIAGGVLLAAIVAVPIVTRSGYLAGTGSQIGINAIIAVALGLLMGYAGQVSLGHAAFYGLGAYSTAILTTRLDAPPLLAMLAGVLLTALVATLVGAPALRLHGHYLAMFTLGLGIIAQVIMEQVRSLTNGFDGIAGVPPFRLWIVSFQSDALSYGLIVAALAGTMIVARNLVHSRPGRALRALHESEEAAGACGVDVARAKLKVFVLSAVLASVAGSLYAHTIGFVSPDPFGFRFSVELVVMIVVGGSANVWGPVAGAALFTLLHQFLRDAGQRVEFLDNLDTVLFGAALVVVVVFWPKGLVSLRLPARLRLRARRAEEGGA